MQNKLLPCPFCGGEVRIAICGDDEYSWWIVTRGKNKAEDKNCHCRVFMESEYFYEEIDGDGESEKENLIEKWNTRKPMEWILEQLKEEAYETEVWDGHYTDKYYKGVSDGCKIAIEIVKGGVEDATN